MMQHELNAAVTRLEADAQLPKRQGGLGPLQRRYATRERLERAVKAVESTAEAGYTGPEFQATAIQVANDAEPKGFIFSSLLSWLIPIVIEWAVKRWLLKRTAT